MNNTKHHC